MTASLKTHAWELMALALFYFVFLGGEYFFDATLASFMSPTDVVLNQGLILGASAFGLLDCVYGCGIWRHRCSVR